MRSRGSMDRVGKKEELAFGGKYKVGEWGSTVRLDDVGIRVRFGD